MVCIELSEPRGIGKCGSGRGLGKRAVRDWWVALWVAHEELGGAVGGS